MTTPQRYFTVQSLAQYWGVSETHIYKLIKDKQLGCIMIGKAKRIPPDFVKAYEAKQCLEPEPQTNTDYGSIRPLASGISSPGAAGTANAYQRGQETATRQNNTAPNT